MDISNINSSIEGDTLVVENNTMANPYIFVQGKMIKSDKAGQELAPIIETGWGYDFGDWTYYGVARPFMYNTKEDLRDNKYHVIALRQGLKRQGIEVK